MSDDTLQPSNDDFGLGDLAILDSYDDQTATAASGYDVDPVEQQFEVCLQNARKVPNVPEDKQAFVNRFKTEWSEKTKTEGRNFLHFLAYTDRNSRGSLRWLMLLAIFSYPKDMGVRDKYSRTPLSAAIESRNEVFIDACMKIFERRGPDIKAALEKAKCVEQDDDKDVDTCLHLAITSNLKPELTKGIIENISEKTFLMQDRRGRTPLHLAVDYEKCSPSQVDIVSHLLRFSPPRALEIRMRKDNMGPSRSAYQHHEITRKLFERKNPGPKEVIEKKSAQETNKNERFDPDWELLEDEKKKKASSRIPSRLRDSFRRSEPGEPSLARQGSDMVSPISQEISTPQEASKPNAPENSSLPDTRQGQAKSANPSIVQLQQTTRKQQEEQKASADKIREQLKLLYLRTTKPNVALRCLQMHDEGGMKSPSRESVRFSKRLSQTGKCGLI